MLICTADIVDLSHVYDQTTLYWPTATTGFELSPLAHGLTEAGYLYTANTFCTPEHGGIHIDAPVHFSERGWTLGDVPIRRLIAPAVVIDITAQTTQDSDYQLTTEDIQIWEQTYGAVPPDGIVLLRTGWSRRWPDAESYLGDDSPGDESTLHFPAYGAEAARVLVEQRRVSALGVDTASIDYGPSLDFKVHQIASASNVVALENLTNVDDVPVVGAWVVALPITIAGGSGGPARVMALHQGP